MLLFKDVGYTSLGRSLSLRPGSCVDNFILGGGAMHAKKGFVLMQVVVVGSCFVFSIISAVFVYQAEKRAINLDFQHEVDATAASLYRQLMVNFEGLYSLAILFGENDIPSFDRFSIEARSILNRHPDIKALEWIPKVAGAERDEYVSKQRIDYPLFEFTERLDQGYMTVESDKEFYYPVYYVEPLIGNEEAFGFDLSSNETRWRALEYAMNTGLPQATATITLVQEHGNQRGFLAFLPIYQGVPTTIENRQKLLKGFVLGVFRVGDTVESSLYGDGMMGVSMKILDETEEGKRDIIYANDPRLNDELDLGGAYDSVLPIFWGRKWSVQATPSSGYIQVRRTMTPWIILGVGFIFSYLVFLYIRSIVKRNLIIQQMVVEKTNELQELNHKLSELSRIDPLTRVANRRVMDEFLEQEWLRARRNGTYLSFMLLDVDYFKNFNDNYGHKQGDICLQMIAKELQSLVKRPTDLIARYGGEEFAIIMADTLEPKAVAEKCCLGIESLGIPHAFSRAARVVTVSIGYHCVKPHGNTTPDILIEAADSALYHAKKAGRNRVYGE